MRLPFHADHIGSLIRPPDLVDAQAQADAGVMTASELEAVQRSSIAAIVHKQQEHGVRALTSGEFDRKWYFSGFFEKLGGFREVAPVPWDLARLAAPPIAALRRAGQQYMMAAVCESKITYDAGASPYLPNWRMLRDAVARDRWAECKFTMPPPCYFHLRLATGKCYDRNVYPDDGAFFADLARAYQAELRTLYDDGLRNLQIDDPTLAYFCSEDMLQALRDDGDDPDALFDTSGSYDKIAQRFFTTLNYDTFFLEYDDPRSGGFEPLRHLPVGKNVVLGVVTTKDPALEDGRVIRDRILEAANVIAEGQGRSVDEAMQDIGISPQCGFASVAVGADGMTEERMFAKLKLVKDVAAELWPDRP
ncbi:Cobalamin-independent synthase, N-terminal domain [Geosmithia morbida]|uniref:Cobalamin-independent synthase, N-terminal domain n=1 Tax=Geosmithia morbida TaxID=1094350 RepID=A0A9P5D5S1_9HYPO|nr:Cobalamin-independent synthase, N-terminal domain [Geosmithia morbida]KAF4122779.1 Cobalamin-independent synthase, N-terminal domain [Geosmithia morbida]